jgi:hypothetical protein
VNHPVLPRLRSLLTLALLCSACVAQLAAAPRTWTDREGRTVEAEFVRADFTHVVIRRVPDGQEFTLRRDRLSPADLAFVEQTLAAALAEENARRTAALDPFAPRPAGTAPSVAAAPWRDTLNQALNLPLFSAEADLWDESPSAIAARLGLLPESTTPGAETWRIYPGSPRTALGAPAYMLALRSEEGRATELTIMFTNRGDHPAFNRPDGSRFVSPSAIKTFETDLARDFQTVRTRLASILPPEAAMEVPAHLRRARPGDLALFSAGRHFLLLHARPGDLISLRVLPAVQTAASRISDDQLRQRWRSLITRRDNGDVVLDRIPMVDQGPKGYCVPATFERLLRYAGIPADLYELATIGGTEHGGGTQIPSMIEGLARTVRQANRRLEADSVKPSPATLSRFIDEGRPVLWALSSTPEFNAYATAYTQARPSDPAALRAYVEQHRRLGREVAFDPSAAHLCLLIGYNRITGELAFSDSWGPDFAERWLPANAVQAASTGEIWTLNF